MYVEISKNRKYQMHEMFQKITQPLCWKRCLLPLPKPVQHCWWLFSCVHIWFPLLLPGSQWLMSVFTSAMLLSLFELGIPLCWAWFCCSRFEYSCMYWPNSYSKCCGSVFAFCEISFSLVLFWWSLTCWLTYNI